LLAEGKAEEIPDFLNNLSSTGLDYAVFVRDFLEFLRKVLISKINPLGQEANLPKEHQEKIKNLAQQFLVTDIIFIIRLFLKAYKDLPSSPSPQVPVLLAGIEAALRKTSVTQKPTAPTEPLKKNDEITTVKPPAVVMETIF